MQRNLDAQALSSKDAPRRVCVTGAGGFIGLHVLRRFLDEGCFVYATVRRSVPEELRALESRGRIALLQLDIRDHAALRKSLLPLPRLEAVVHCAAKASDVGREATFRKTNFEAVRELAGMALKRDDGVFVHVSTTDVYGLRDFKGESEAELDFDHQERNPYPKFKILAEEWLRRNMPPNKYSIIRPAAVWGGPEAAITRRMTAFLRFSPWIVHFGPWRGQNRWPLAHVERVAEACYLAAVSPLARGRAFNVLDPERVTMEEAYRRVARKYFPDKKFRTLCLPFWCGAVIGALSSATAFLGDMEEPPFDPSWYALRSISCNLDFSPALLECCLQEHRRDKPDSAFLS